VNEEAHAMFSAIEEVVRAHLRVENVRKISEGVTLPSANLVGRDVCVCP